MTDYINPQRPFAYLPRKRANPPSRDWWVKFPTHLPPNIHGLCPYCARPYQKVTVVPLAQSEIREDGPTTTTVYCPKCGEDRLFRFPKHSVPWLLAPSPTTPNDNFRCEDCGKFYRSFRLFGTLCKHLAHQRYVCRVCCNDKRTALTQVEREDQEIQKRKALKISKRRLPTPVIGRYSSTPIPLTFIEHEEYPEPEYDEEVEV